MHAPLGSANHSYVSSGSAAGGGCVRRSLKRMTTQQIKARERAQNNKASKKYRENQKENKKRLAGEIEELDHEKEKRLAEYKSVIDEIFILIYIAKESGLDTSHLPENVQHIISSNVNPYL